jgi:putative phage-type endonuclease
MASLNETLFPNLPPKIIKLEQRTPDWHAWRNGKTYQMEGKTYPDIGGPRITASMLPMIMGLAPWGDAYTLWMELTGRAPPRESNWAMQKGINIEPKARSDYTNKTGIEVNDICVEHPIVPWIAASLDGFSLFGDTLAEIKLPGGEDHGLAIMGKVPDKYVPQTHWQLLNCPTARVNHYWSYDGESGVLVEVFPDREYEEMLYNIAAHFRDSVINDVPPYGEEFSKLALDLRKLYEEKKELEDKYKELSVKLQQLIPEYSPSASFGGVLVSKTGPRVTIDYDALLKHLNVDSATVEQFKKKPKAEQGFRVTVNTKAPIPDCSVTRMGFDEVINVHFGNEVSYPTDSHAACNW